VAQGFEPRPTSHSEPNAIAPIIQRAAIVCRPVITPAEEIPDTGVFHKKVTPHFSGASTFSREYGAPNTNAPSGGKFQRQPSDEHRESDACNVNLAKRGSRRRAARNLNGVW